MNEKSAAYERNDVRSAATSVRFLKTLTGTSAERDRDSTTANVASSATAPPKKIQGHPGPSVNSPLANTPTDADVPPIAPKIPSAQFLSRPSANVTARIDSADGATRAAPNPWNARAAISNPADSDRPATSEAPQKIAESSAQQQKATKKQAIGDHDPLQGALPHAEIHLDGRQRDIHDRDIENHHELRGATQGQDQRLFRATDIHRLPPPLLVLFFPSEL